MQPLMLPYEVVDMFKNVTDEPNADYRLFRPTARSSRHSNDAPTTATSMEPTLKSVTCLVSVTWLYRNPPMKAPSTPSTIVDRQPVLR